MVTVNRTTDVDYYSLAEVAERLGVSVTTVQIWCADGVLETNTRPRGRIVSYRELDRFLAERGTTLSEWQTSYTTAEIAGVLGVTRNTVSKWIKQGYLDAVHIGKAIRRITQSALDAFLGDIPMDDLKQDTYLAADLVKLLRVSEYSVRQWIRSGRIATVQLASIRLITRPTLEAFLSRFDLSLAECKTGLLTLDEVASLLQISHKDVLTGDLKLVRLSSNKRMIRITQKSLAEYLVKNDTSLDIPAELASIQPRDYSPGDEKNYTVIELADLIGVSHSTVYLWIPSGQLITENFTDRQRVSARELDRFLAERGTTLDELLQGTYKLPDIARVLDIPRDMIYRWVYQGHLKTCQFSGRLIVTRSALVTFLGKSGVMKIADFDAAFLE